MSHTFPETGKISTIVFVFDGRDGYENEDLSHTGENVALCLQADKLAVMSKSIERGKLNESVSAGKSL
jgi:hypothetical protein